MATPAAAAERENGPDSIEARIAALGRNFDDDDEPLDSSRLIVAALAMVILVLCFTPAPISEILAPGS